MKNQESIPHRSDSVLFQLPQGCLLPPPPPPHTPRNSHMCTCTHTGHSLTEHLSEAASSPPMPECTGSPSQASRPKSPSLALPSSNGSPPQDPVSTPDNTLMFHPHPQWWTHILSSSLISRSPLPVVDAHIQPSSSLVSHLPLPCWMSIMPIFSCVLTAIPSDGHPHISSSLYPKGGFRE